MAITKIKQKKSTLSKALDYIENPEKTQQQLLVSGYNVDPLLASIEFAMTAELAKQIKGNYDRTGGDNVLAYHLVQSFAYDDNCTAQQAHEIGKQWADEVLGGKYEYVIATHVDKGQIHNHIIFNAVSFYDHKKFRSEPYKTVAFLRKASDKICEEHGLSVIKPWRQKIKEIIDQAILNSSTYEEFEKILTEQNVEIKNGKKISFRISHSEQKRFVRGNTIGEQYSKEAILQRLQQSPEEKQSAWEKKKQREIEREKQSEYCQSIKRKSRKSRVAATKQLAQVLLTLRNENIQNESDFEKQIQEILEQIQQSKRNMQEINKKNKEYKDVAKYIATFHKYLPVKQEYEKQFFFKKWYAARYQGELQSFDHAAKQLEKLGISSDTDLEKILEMVKYRDQRSKEISEEIKQLKKRMKELQTAQQMVQQLQQDQSAKKGLSKKLEAER